MTAMIKERYRVEIKQYNLLLCLQAKHEWFVFESHQVLFYAMDVRTKGATFSDLDQRNQHLAWPNR